MGEMNLALQNIVGTCFDGAFSMKGIDKGLANLMKVASPIVLYVH